MQGFARSLAYIIGIDRYGNGIPRLRSAVNDARRLAEILDKDHGYQVQLLTDDGATRAALDTLLGETLPQTVTSGDRLLLYFAGHGIALESDDGPAGYLIPQDADRDDPQTFLSMRQVAEGLGKLDCRHFLLILDCCFAGAFRWASSETRGSIGPMYRETYERFIKDPAWQVLTSAAYDQHALDVLSGLGGRGEVEQVGDKVSHSPFALHLYNGLAGEADISPKQGDGVISASELYLYLRDQIEPATIESNKRQTPGLWPLKKHDKGEFIFRVPGREVTLPPAPALNKDNNPYRGLQPYEEAHQDVFFGREKVTEALTDQVKRQPFTAVVGASGTGKSSLVRAGLVPRLHEAGWQVLGPIRPGAHPTQTLATVDMPSAAGSDSPLSERIRAWRTQHPDTPLALVVDQLEELITLCRDDEECKTFQEQLRMPSPSTPASSTWC